MRSFPGCEKKLKTRNDDAVKQDPYRCCGAYKRSMSPVHIPDGLIYCLTGTELSDRKITESVGFPTVSVTKECEMEIKKDYYLQQLIDRRENGLIKVIRGIRRCGGAGVYHRGGIICRA